MGLQALRQGPAGWARVGQQRVIGLAAGQHLRLGIDLQQGLMRSRKLAVLRRDAVHAAADRNQQIGLVQGLALIGQLKKKKKKSS